MTAIMLHGHEFYVRIDERDEALERVRTVVGEATSVHAEPGNPYCVVLWARRDFVPPESHLERLSRDLGTEVLWLAWQKQVDAFAFQRWVDGAPVRRLAHGVLERERTWEVVDGTAEAWEAEALFPPERLERQLRVSRLYPDADELPEAELRRVWNERLLVAGSRYPQLVAIDAAWVVARYYRLPLWPL